jgi:hemerythrin-like domain-containing protein
MWDFQNVIGSIAKDLLSDRKVSSIDSMAEAAEVPSAASEGGAGDCRNPINGRMADMKFSYALQECSHDLMTDNSSSRRDFFRVSALAGTELFLAGTAPTWAADPKPEPAKDAGQPKPEEDISPAEDLMREHGVLKRVMLVYEEVLRRWDKKDDVPPEILADAAGMIRHFVEDYHEKLEEDYLFPRFEKANRLTDLVQTLRDQHQAGRKVTDIVMQRANARDLKNTAERAKVAEAIRQFNRMYAPHEAREDTVLFPAFRSLVSGNEYDSLGEDFEKKENELFGEKGFEKMVDKVAGMEKKLGIYDLTQFTPKIK